VVWVLFAESGPLLFSEKFVTESSVFPQFAAEKRGNRIPPENISFNIGPVSFSAFQSLNYIL
jgi:hypothetical protein